mgnify:CR=1 FL=1
MIIDASALVAMAVGEPEREDFFMLAATTSCSTSVSTWLEACLVVDNRSPRHARTLDSLVATLELAIVPVTLEQGRIAREAHRRFGRGSGSRARSSAPRRW